MDLTALKTEIQTDPLILGYGVKSDIAIAEILNSKTTGRTRSREVVPSWEIVEATDPTEWEVLSTQEKQRYSVITGLGVVNLKGSNVRGMLGKMFGPGTATRTSLIALQSESISRAEELFNGGVTHVNVGRALRGV